MSLNTSAFTALLDTNVLSQLGDILPVFPLPLTTYRRLPGYMTHLSTFASLRSKVVTFNFKSWNSTTGGHKELVISFINEKTVAASIPDDWGRRIFLSHSKVLNSSSYFLENHLSQNLLSFLIPRYAKGTKSKYTEKQATRSKTQTFASIKNSLSNKLILSYQAIRKK